MTTTLKGRGYRGWCKTYVYFVITRSASTEGRRGDFGPLLCHSEGALRYVILKEPFASVILRSEATKDLAQDKLRD